MDNVLFDGLSNLARVLISAPVLYFAVIAFIRVSGKRSTSQMNNFDWIVTVAMGSLVASGIVLKDVTVLEVLLAIAVLLVLQYFVTRTIIASERVAGWVKASPTLLVYDGEFRRVAMICERVSEKEIYAALRDNGVSNLSDAAAVVLETDATLSVLPKGEKPLLQSSTYEDVGGWPVNGNGEQASDYS